MAQLPPKIPTMLHPNWPPTFPPNPTSSRQPHPPPSATTAAAGAPLWVDEFLDFTSVRRGTHRRSMSDSIAFLEAAPLALVEECRTSLHGGEGGFERLDDEQLMSMFSDGMGCGGEEVGVVGSPSDQNSNSEEKQAMSTDENKGENNEGGQNKVAKIEVGEVESMCKAENPVLEPPPSDCNAIHQLSAGDLIFDPKRVKRILANRQSAQRSRVRKLQYISDLERSVTTLQTEVSALSPRVAFLDHQRLILNVDNSALKQRIAALAQDKIFKDAHQEALKKEIERLRQIYNEQQQQQNNLKQMVVINNNNNSKSNNHSDHNSISCTDKEQLMT